MHYRAISNRDSHFEVFERERERELFTLVCLRIMKHGDPVGDPKIMGLFYIYSHKLCLLSTSNVLFSLRLLLAVALLICVSQVKT